MRYRNRQTGKVRVATAERLHPWVQLKPAARAGRHLQKSLKQSGIYQISFFFKALEDARSKVCKNVGLSLRTCIACVGGRGNGHECSSKPT